MLRGKGRVFFHLWYIILQNVVAVPRRATFILVHLFSKITSTCSFTREYISLSVNTPGRRYASCAVHSHFMIWPGKRLMMYNVWTDGERMMPHRDRWQKCHRLTAPLLTRVGACLSRTRFKETLHPAYMGDQRNERGVLYYRKAVSAWTKNWRLHHLLRKFVLTARAIECKVRVGILDIISSFGRQRSLLCPIAIPGGRGTVRAVPGSSGTGATWVAILVDAHRGPV